jgi:hypothetical protein
LVIVTLPSTSRRPVHPFETPEEYAGYRVLDPEGREVGTVKGLFKSADNGLDCVEINTGFLGLQSVVIPVNLVAVDDTRQALLLR